MDMYGMNGMGNGYYYDPSNPYLNAGFQGQPMYFCGQPVQPMNSSLTDEEIQRLRQNRGGSVLNLSVDQDTILRAMCNHRDKGQDVVQVKSDGSGEVWCPICGESWSMEELSKEEVQELVNKLLAQMQIAKWAGNIPNNIIRDYFSIMPLVAKFPDVYDYAMKNFNRMVGANGMYFSTDAMPYAQYNSMFPGGSMNYNVVNPFNTGYYQPGYQPNMMGQQQMGQMANPNVNPMQAQGFNPQFVNQQNMMLYNQQYQQAGQQMPPQGGNFMNQPPVGGYYQQQIQPTIMGQQQMGQPYQPNFGVAQAQQQAQQTPPAQAAPVTTETKAEL